MLYGTKHTHNHNGNMIANVAPPSKSLRPRLHRDSSLLSANECLKYLCIEWKHTHERAATEELLL